MQAQAPRRIGNPLENQPRIDIGGVGRQNGVFRHDGSQSGKRAPLDLQILEHRFNRQIGIVCCRVIGSG